MKDRKIYAIGDDGDLDSICSRAVIKRHLDEQTLPFLFRTIDYGKEDLALEGVNTGDTVIMFDLGYNTSPAQLRMQDRIRELRAGGSSIEFYDHHNWPPELLKELFSKLVHKPGLSSAFLLATAWRPTDLWSGYLGVLATCDDFSIKHPVTTDLVDLLQAGYDTNALTAHLAVDNRDNVVPADAAQVIADYREWRDKTAIPALRDSYQTEAVNDVNVTTGLCDGRLYMKPGWRVMLGDKPKDIVLCFYTGKNNVLFEARTPENFSRIKNEFQGGGRETGGGFLVPEPVSVSNYEALRADVMERMRKILG